MTFLLREFRRLSDPTAVDGRGQENPIKRLRPSLVFVWLIGPFGGCISHETHQPHRSPTKSGTEVQSIIVIVALCPRCPCLTGLTRRLHCQRPRPFPRLLLRPFHCPQCPRPQPRCHTSLTPCLCPRAHARRPRPRLRRRSPANNNYSHFKPCHVSLGQYHSEPVMPTVTAKAEPSRYSFPSTTGTKSTTTKLTTWRNACLTPCKFCEVFGRSRIQHSRHCWQFQLGVLPCKTIIRSND